MRLSLCLFLAGVTLVCLSVALFSYRVAVGVTGAWFIGAAVLVLPQGDRE